MTSMTDVVIVQFKHTKHANIVLPLLTLILFLRVVYVFALDFSIKVHSKDCTSKVCNERFMISSRKLLKLACMSRRTFVNRKLTVARIGFYNVTSPHTCMRDCLFNYTCFSINLFMAANPILCKILYGSVFSERFLLAAADGWTHISMNVRYFPFLHKIISYLLYYF